MTDSKGKHGGRRLGAGRKPDLTKQIEKAESLAARLNLGTQVSLAELADKAPQLMRSALDAALAGDKGMQKFLLDMLVRLGKVGDEDASPIADLVNKWRGQGDVHLHQHIHEGSEPPKVTILDASR